ncbi:hypothetical protein PVAND_012490 [Polypedilum vanderplanki]|uniref:Protein sleepless n=1 Tax=Polypedilum vanderplanki TaxID=319348 RepID=A0A9J6CLP8_POLVA|nr:hypothetical protein PVAND_012490 [Polypedilum vanderplanki]
MRHSIKILFIVTVCCFSSSVALRCFQCISNREGNCDKERNMEFKECDTTVDASNSLNVQPVCIKIVRDIRGVDLITRTCGFEGSLLHPCSNHKSADHCSTCYSDLCNESTKITVNYSLIFAALIGYFAFLFIS